jgi:hypothetical protein
MTDRASWLTSRGRFVAVRALVGFPERFGMRTSWHTVAGGASPSVHRGLST